MAHDIFVPVIAVMAIYARENGRGMVFSEEEEDTEAPPPKQSSSGKDSKGKPHLTVVK